MIVKMKKLTLLCTRSSQEKTVTALRDLGAVHVEPSAPLEGTGLEQARTRLVYVKRALEVLQKHPHVPSSGEPVDQVIANVWRELHRIHELEEKRDDLQQELRRLLPLGDFDPSLIRELAGQGVSVQLFQISIKQPLPETDGCVIRTLSRDRSSVYFALISRNGHSRIDAQELPLPERSLAAVRKQTGEVEQQLSSAERSLSLYAGDRARVAAVVQDSENLVRYLEVQSGMGSAGELAYLQGFFPAEKETLIQQAAATNGWAALIREAGEGDEPPTLLRSPKWVEPIKAVFDMIGVTPGYHEVDISAAFLVFFSIFFAMLVGDAGYGVLFLILTLTAKIKLRKAPQQVFNLLLITSVCTIIWGVLTGTYFGLSEIPAPLKQLRLGWLTGEGAENNLMLLCFVIGAVHLTIAHAWNAIRICNTWQVLAQIGWIGSTWTMFFAARTMVLGEVFPPFMLNVLWTSIALILLFMNPVKKIKTEWFNYVILPLNIVSNFVDLVSYLRLFAVGAAGFAVANAFNQMAFEAGAGKFLGGLITAVIIFAAHALNIMLSAMGVMVHGIRLNTLEFSGHIGVQWAGRRYAPFRKISTTDG